MQGWSLTNLTDKNLTCNLVFLSDYSIFSILILTQNSVDFASSSGEANIFNANGNSVVCRLVWAKFQTCYTSICTQVLRVCKYT